MKTAFFHCFSGISGDMCLGALVDAGAPLNALRRELKKLDLKGYALSVSEVNRSGLRACKVSVKLKGPAPDARRLRDLRGIINSSGLSHCVRQQGLGVFRRLFEAEASVHGSTPGRVHLHELGAVDAIVDIIGTLICLELLGIEQVACSPLNLGSGTIRTAHGMLPVPAPATAELLKGMPVYSEGLGEMTTPTGAALMAELAQDRAGPLPAMRVETTGTGAGEMDPGDRPNVLRVLIGDSASCSADHRVSVIETNIDDMSPEIMGYVMERLFEAGALDVWMTPGLMKKSRPGTVLGAICREHDIPAMTEIILAETTTLGLRHHTADRITLGRRTRTVSTPYGNIPVKDALSASGDVLKSSVEYEAARLSARKHRVPIRKVMEAALQSGNPRGKGRL